MSPRLGDRRELGAMPFVAIIVAWWALPKLVQYPAYMLPSIGTMLDFARDSLLDGSLLIRAEQGAAFSRETAEREAREILTLVLAAAASDSRPVLPAVPARPFSVLSEGSTA